MSFLAAKVWGEDELEPEGLFNKQRFPHVPDSWWREEPRYVAELYALERAGEAGRERTKRRVHVIDEGGVKHVFDVECAWQPTAVSIERIE